MKARALKSNRDRIPILIGMQKPSLKDLLQKANEKYNTQEVPETKDDTTDVTVKLSPPPSSFFPEDSHSNSLSELPFHSEETVK